MQKSKTKLAEGQNKQQTKRQKKSQTIQKIKTKLFTLIIMANVIITLKEALIKWLLSAMGAHSDGQGAPATGKAQIDKKSGEATGV